MDRPKNIKSLISAARAGAMRALGFFRAPAKGQTARDAARRAFTFADPTRVMLPSDEDDERNVDARHEGALPLGMRLEDCAHAMVRRADLLREQADKLAARIADHAAAEVSLMAQAMRVMIALGWLIVAGWLYLAGADARAAGETILANGVLTSDAPVLVRSFFIVAATGFGVAFAIAALINLFGDGATRRIQREAEELGLAIADTAREFDAALTHFRESMDRRANPADGIIDLSRAHMTALEACAFFRTVPFLTNLEGEDARRQFRYFLRRQSGNPNPTPIFLSGLVLGAFAHFIASSPPPEIDASQGLAIARYSWAANLLFFGGLAYAGVGVLMSLFSGALGAGAAAKGRERALEAMRSAFTAHEAPRPSDIIRRIEDAVDVYRARTGGRGARAQASAETGSDQDESAIPHWRRRDSSAKFVDTGFQAAPTRWRTDAYAKKFDGDEDGDPGAKRGLLGLKNKPRD